MSDTEWVILFTAFGFLGGFFVGRATMFSAIDKTIAIIDDLIAKAKEPTP